MQKTKAFLWLLIFVFVFSVMTGCQEKSEQDLYHVKSNPKHNHKKIIFLMIDSLMYQGIDEGIRLNELPAFQFLIQQGQYYKNMVSSFPTMSVTIDSSLMTGAYPDKHRVPGLIWYSPDSKKVVNYGTGPMEVIKHGANSTAVDTLFHLNKSHLNPKLPTLYDELSKRGLKSGSINGLIYRGQASHHLSIPPWIHAPTSLGSDIKVKGPDFLALGSLSNPLLDFESLPDGITSHMGFNDQYSMETVKYLVKEDKLPDFLFVYLPDLDKKIHQKGPPSLEGIKEVDQQLQTLLQWFNSPGHALEDVIFMITGDSGMSPLLPEDENAIIDLPAFFEDYRVWRTGEEVNEQTDIILAVNETMAYIYNLTDQPLEEMAKRLAADPRIAFISWKDKEWMYAVEGQGDTTQTMRFKAYGDWIDPYRQKWTVQQDLGVLDLKANAADHSLSFGEYPDALRRLSGALHSHPGEFLVVTARPGYEFADRLSPKHPQGGGHGSLHRIESLVPLIIAGTNQKPAHLRMVDLKAFILKLLTEK